MISLIPLVLVALIVVTVVVVRGARSSSPGAEPPSAEGQLGDDLARWVAAGLLSEEQSRAIRVHEAVAAPAPSIMPAPVPGTSRPARGGPAVAEALGYLGGVLASTGVVLLVARYWTAMATAGRLALSGAGALVLVGAGALVKEALAPALARLRWFLWLASTVMTGVFMRVVVDGLGSHAADTVVLACAGGVALESGLLWWRRARPLQELTFLGGVAAFAGAAVGELVAGGWVGWVGITEWALGVVLLTVGLRRLLPLPTLAVALGAAIIVVGGLITASDWSAFGWPLLVASGFGLLAVATVPGLATVRADQRAVGIVGGIALVQAVPGALAYFSHDGGAATGIVTVAVGAMLLVVGVRHLARMATTAEVVGCAMVLGGAALTGMQWHGVAPVFGIAAAIGLLGLGMLPRQVPLSVFGSVGLLINVPWAILHFFPGRGRAPLLILVSGVLIVGIAVFLSLRGRWLHPDITGKGHRRPPSGFAPGAT